MDADRFNKIQTIFEAAIGRPVGDRSAFLDEACGDDVTIRREVEDLLHCDQESDELLDQPVFDVKSMVQKFEEDSGTSLRPMPETIGAYKVIDILGRGGVSVVYRAQQQSPRRMVAIKVLESSEPSPKLLRRFELESHVLGQLEHPGIGRIYEAGEEDGRAYFAMELINGSHITDHCRNNNLTVDDRLRIFMQVCDAIGFAHQQEVIHRDLKPANILVDASGRTKIVDFGIARLTSVSRDMTTVHTAIGQLLGTIPYMSPEQIAGRHDIIGPTSDIYSLGVILFELLVGRLPYDLSNKTLPEAARTIREEQPESLGSISRELRGPLDKIIARMLHKEPDERYQSAAEVLDDIELYLQHGDLTVPTDVVIHESRSRNEPAPKSHRIALFGLLMLILLVIGLSLALGLYSRSERNYRTSVRQEWITRLAAAEALLQLGQVEQAQAALDGVPDEGRDWEWRHLQSRLDGSLDLLMSTSAPLRTIVASRDGLQFAAGDDDGHIYLWQLGDAEPKVLRAHTGTVTALDFDEQGDLLASASQDTTIRVWDTSSGNIKGDIPGHATAVTSLSFQPGSQHIVSGGLDGVVHRWDVRTSALLDSMPSLDAVGPVAFSPDGTRVARADGADGIGIWRLDGNAQEPLVEQRPFDGQTGPIEEIVWNPSSTHVAMIDEDGAVRIMDAQNGQVISRWYARDGAVKNMLLQDNVVTLASHDRVIHRFDAMTGKPLPGLIGHTYGVRSIAPAGQDLLVSASSDGTVRRWDIGDLKQQQNRVAHRFSLRDDGSELLALHGSPHTNVVDLWSLESVKAKNPALNGRNARDAVFAFDDQSLFVLSGDGMRIEQWDASQTQPMREWNLPEPAHRLVVHPAGGFIAAYSPDMPLLAVLDLSTDQVKLLDQPRSPIETAVFIKEGPRLVTGHIDGTIHLWEVVSGQRVPFQGMHEGAVRFVRITPDQVALVSGGDDGMVRLWSLNNLTMDIEFGGNVGPLTSAAFHPSGDRLLTGGADTFIRIWDPVLGDHVLALTGHQSALTDMAFTQNGEELITADQSGRIRIWPITTSSPLEATQ